MRPIFCAILVAFLVSTSSWVHAQDTTSAQIDTTVGSAAAILSPASPEYRERFMRKWRLITGALVDFRSALTDSDVSFVLRSRPPLALTREELAQFSPPRDFVADELYRRQLGTVPPLNLNPLLQGATRLLADALPSGKRPRRISTIPSPLEADILSVLWRDGTATRGDVYASLDTVWRITAEDLDRLLEEMVQKGLLARKKISPENALSITTPLGVVSIEMSNLNRKNVNYVYWPLVDRQKLITFLDAQLYLASSTSPLTGDGRALSYQRALLETLYRLSASPSP
jgi:hypothetical protein